MYKPLLLIFLFAFSVSSCYRDKHSYRQASMQQVLADLITLDTFPRNSTLMDQGVLYCGRQLAAVKDDSAKSELTLRLAYYLIASAQNDSAVSLLDSFINGHQGSTQKLAIAWQFKALAYNRAAEIINCRANYKTGSCILPFTPQAQYKDTAALNKAITCYKKALSYNSNDFTSRWLLNIAYRAAGQPEDNGAEYFINLAQYDNSDTIVKFKAETAFTEGVGLLGGNAIEDFNNDGFIDFFTTSYNLKDNTRLYLSKNDGSFTDYTTQAGLTGITAGSHVITTDYNNDGYKDIFIIRGGWMREAGLLPNSLLRNNGNETFTDVTIEAGLFSIHTRHTACWADINNDGWLDLFVGNEKWSENAGPQYSELYLNNKNGTFTEASKKSGVIIDEYVKGAVFGDIDNDGFIDLYVSCFGTPNKLYHNNGNSTFTEIAKQAGVQQPLFSFPCMFFDFNNDGWQDIFVPGYFGDDVELASEYLGIKPTQYPPCLYINNHNLTFTNIAPQAGLTRSILAMGLNFADVDNDGWQDIYAGTGFSDLRSVWPNLLFHNEGGKSFTDITSTSRTGFLQKGHSVSFGDVDNDGDNDIFLDLGGFVPDDKYRNILLINQGTKNNWVGLHLTGTKTNKAAIGTTIKITVEENGVERNIYRTISTGASYGCNTFAQLIGIGKAPFIKLLEIHWPVSNTTLVFKNVTAGKYYNIIEGDKALNIISKKPLQFKRENDIIMCN